MSAAGPLPRGSHRSPQGEGTPVTDPDNSAEISLDVTVNGRVHSLPAHSSLADLVARLGHAPGSIATAVNGEFVARNQRAQRVLCGGDHVNGFEPIVGG